MKQSITALKNQPMAGKTALVTGGSRGIGRAIAIELALYGAHVLINYSRNDEAALEALQKIRESGGSGALARFDVSDALAAVETAASIVKERGSLDILVNNAGATLDGLFVRTKDSDWKDVINTNLGGVFNCCRAATKYMMKKRWGRIINISSIVAETGNAGQACYSAAKAGIIGLTKSLARELGSRNVTANVVAPGFIETDMTAGITADRREAVLSQIPLGRTGTPKDIGFIVRFLASDEASYITGQVIRINGGLYM